MENYKIIEEKLREILSGARLKDALDFVAYLKESGRTCTVNSNHPSAIFNYLGEYSCLVVYEKDNEDPRGRWFALCWRNHYDVYEPTGFPVDKNLKEFAQNNIHRCSACGGCRSYGFGPTSRVVFEKKYDNVCNDIFHFYSPEDDDLKNVVKLMELQKYIIANQ